MAATGVSRPHPGSRPRSRSYKLLLFPAHATPEYHSLHAVTARPPHLHHHLPFHLEPLPPIHSLESISTPQHTSHSFHHFEPRARTPASSSTHTRQLAPFGNKTPRRATGHRSDSQQRPIARRAVGYRTSHPPRCYIATNPTLRLFLSRSTPGRLVAVSRPERRFKESFRQHI